MKARIVAGIFASLLFLSAAPAGAAPKKRGARAPATAVAGAAKPAASGGDKSAPRKAKSKRKAKAAHPTRPAAAAKPAAASPTKAATYVEPSPEPLGKAPASPAKAVIKANSTTQENAAALNTAAREEPSAPESAAPAREPDTRAALGGSRFLASGVPLAEVQKGRFRGPGNGKQPCGTKARWARSKSRWHALDAWGQVTGTLTIGGSERYEGTGCHQVWFSEGTGKDGLGVFVADGSGYSAGPSAEWRADPDSRKRFERLYSAQERAWTEAKAGGDAAARRTLFFRLPAQEAAAEGSPTQQRPARWAVSGGRVLVIAYVGATGAWKVGHVLPPNGKRDAYEPLAVLDMNGDGLPEIVVHEEAGGVFTDRVLSFDPASMRWETAVESPGGASR